MQHRNHRIITVLLTVFLTFLLAGAAIASEEHEAEAAHAGSALGQHLPIWSGLPFMGILLSIALFPLFKPVWWHHNFGKVSLFWALVFALPFLLVYGGEAVYEILHIYLADYIPFIILLWGLYTASGGILIRGTLAGTPLVNLILLVIGTVLASWIGTTGASMLLIRPVIRANRMRKSKMHVIIFFIFLVSNIGGSLTPLGDPPLFLGFLHGVPFFWTLKLFPHMAFISVLLLAIFFIVDTLLYKREGSPEGDATAKEPVKLDGLHNFVFLAGIMAAVIMSGKWHPGEISVFGVHMSWSAIARDVLIVIMGLLSLASTQKKTREDNAFNWFAIKEVAILFAGIFMTIIPALAMLRAGAQGPLAGLVNFVREPFHYFWIAGSLSSFLDNAPTYLTFFNMALGRLGLTEPMVTEILKGIISSDVGREFIMTLKGISVGAVFFGAVTYIGNAPNFMVRSIAEENKIQMPSFFGYMIWSVGILCPLFLVVTWVFF
jgi:Na+/H+ antiporter NhaD/arsenite permease-like protein